jgi:hypothetical protein
MALKYCRAESDPLVRVDRHFDEIPEVLPV